MGAGPPAPGAGGGFQRRRAYPIALGLGIAAVRFSNTGLRSLLVAAGSVAETFPSAAVLALAVPSAGFGFAPTFLALSLYGMLPVLHNTIAGLRASRRRRWTPPGAWE
ncbi:MAG: hypothetical protein MZV65_16105 [Chromatiales bacterium]|nr:hypothetical protein [Chromatiales bacterium]